MDVDPGSSGLVGLELGATDVVGMDAAPEAAGGGVVPGVAVAVGVGALARGAVGAVVGSPHAIAIAIKMIIAPARIQPLFIISSKYFLHLTHL